MLQHCGCNEDSPSEFIIDREVEMKRVASIEDLAGFLVDRLAEVDYRDGHAGEHLRSRKVFGNADSVAHHAIPRDVEPPTGTDKRILVDLDSDFSG